MIHDSITYYTGWFIWSWTWVGLTLIWMFHHLALLHSPLCQTSSCPKQNSADSRMPKINVNTTQFHNHQPHPVYRNYKFYLSWVYGIVAAFSMIHQTWHGHRCCVELRSFKPARLCGEEEILVRLIRVTRCRRPAVITFCWRQCGRYLINFGDCKEKCQPGCHYDEVARCPILCGCHSRFIMTPDQCLSNPLSTLFQFCLIREQVSGHKGQTWWKLHSNLTCFTLWTPLLLYHRHTIQVKK